MQSLDIISVNIWHIIISLCNLVLLYLILKKFLYKPVKKVLAKRNEEIDGQYEYAKNAEQSALENKKQWETKMAQSEETANNMIKKAAETAELRSEKIISDAKAEAQGIIRRAEAEALLEKANAQAQMKKEIADVSTQIAQKMLEREVSEDDHRRLIDSFLDKIGDEND